MVTRIVKMSFRSDSTETFLALFEQYKKHIRNADGCMHLSLLRDQSAPHIFFTYSRWADESDLDRYRNSSLFREVWPATKALFAQPAEAWTLQEEVIAAF